MQENRHGHYPCVIIRDQGKFARVVNCEGLSHGHSHCCLVITPLSAKLRVNEGGCGVDQSSSA